MSYRIVKVLRAIVIVEPKQYQSLKDTFRKSISILQYKFVQIIKGNEKQEFLYLTSEN